RGRRADPAVRRRGDRRGHPPRAATPPGPGRRQPRRLTVLGPGGHAAPMPPVVSIINYKGGVGKTTLTANIGAELARRGRRVLLVDLDPQASLSFSFYRPVEWVEQLAESRTVLQWFASYNGTGDADPLRKYGV